LASGLPVIALDGGGNREILQNGVNGFLIHQRNPERVADLVMTLFYDQDLSYKIACKGQEFASNFDIERYVDCLLEVYKKSK
jgi:spore coat protein SA